MGLENMLVTPQPLPVKDCKGISSEQLHLQSSTFESLGVLKSSC